MDAATLQQAMPGLSLDRAKSEVDQANEALRLADCTTVNRAAMFLAQVGHESMSLRYTEEIASGAAYEGRADLGNTHRGDGTRFKGRSYIQVTGRHNYRNLSKWAHGRGLVPNADYFIDHPGQLANAKYRWYGPVWYWVTQRPMNDYADRGDLYRATVAVNGGTNGLSDRTQRWNRCRGLGKALLPTPATATAVTATAKSVKPQRGAVGTVTADKGVPARTVPGGKFVRVKGKIPRRRKGYRLKIGGVRKKDGITWVTGPNRGWWHNASAFTFHLPPRRKMAGPKKGRVAVADQSVPVRTVPGGRFVRIKGKIPRRRKGYKLWVGGIRKTKDGTVWITGPNGGWWHNAAAFTYYSRKES